MLLSRQTQFVTLDPYANAFLDERVRPMSGDYSDMRPGVYERKYELDSIASVLRLSVGYFEATGFTRLLHFYPRRA